MYAIDSALIKLYEKAVTFMSNKPIYVTRPHLPPLEEFIPYLEEIWNSQHLTNNGPFHGQLEQALCDYLGVKHISLFTNGTIALITALQALQISGEVITTPYTFVATSHALLWNNIKPVFVDIDPVTLNLDPSKIEAAITEHTQAIMPVHCYGNPCDIDAIARIAEQHKLKVIYDAAHAFGVQDDHGSILNHGDLSILSFHATKVFNTFEGGAIISPDAKTKQHIDYLKDFGFSDELTIVAPGINGKMSEVNAAFGLLQLKHIDQAIARRKEIALHYREALQGISGIHLVSETFQKHANHSYFPVLIDNDYPISRDALYNKLQSHNIYTRRYFYPLISNLPMYQELTSSNAQNLSVANRTAKQILCLPIYPTLENNELDKIISIIREA